MLVSLETVVLRSQSSADAKRKIPPTRPGQQQGIRLLIYYWIGPAKAAPADILVSLVPYYLDLATLTVAIPRCHPARCSRLFKQVDHVAIALVLFPPAVPPAVWRMLVAMEEYISRILTTRTS